MQGEIEDGRIPQRGQRHPRPKNRERNAYPGEGPPSPPGIPISQPPPEKQIQAARGHRHQRAQQPLEQHSCSDRCPKAIGPKTAAVRRMKVFLGGRSFDRTQKTVKSARNGQREEDIRYYNPCKQVESHAGPYRKAGVKTAAASESPSSERRGNQ